MVAWSVLRMRCSLYTAKSLLFSMLFHLRPRWVNMLVAIDTAMLRQTATAGNTPLYEFLPLVLFVICRFEVDVSGEVSSKCWLIIAGLVSVNVIQRIDVYQRVCKRWTSGEGLALRHWISCKLHQCLPMYRHLTREPLPVTPSMLFILAWWLSNAVPCYAFLFKWIANGLVLNFIRMLNLPQLMVNWEVIALGLESL